jgi:hypothetical protein
MTNPAGAAIVNTIGPIRQVTQSTGATPKRYLVIAAGTPAQLGEPVQVQTQQEAAGGRCRSALAGILHEERILIERTVRICRASATADEVIE